MGGIGKTALATNAYLDPLIIEHFHIRAWVTVSQDYSAQRIVSDLLFSVKEFNTERSDQNNEEKVYKALEGRKFLIVMDDMWSTQSWDDVRRIFPDDNNGSRILLTTRLSDVAAYADSCSHLHEMHLMDSDQSWDLLRQKVFKQEELCPLELEDTGKAIARSCIGMPLAIVVIAGLLSSVSRTRASWEEIAENVTSTIATENGQLEKIMSLSYTHLPHHLRPCFLYMGAFPEDHVVHVSKLVKLWVAERFLKYPNGSKSLEEEVAEEYLEELVKRSLVLVSKRKSSGKIKSCKLHDLVRELCIRKAHQEKFLLHVMDGRVPENVIKDQRHVSINQYGLDCLANIYGSTIHTLICFLSTKWSDRYLEHFILLRVLDLVSSHFNPYDVEAGPRPAKLFGLYHLRYLAFNYHIEIPPTISDLQNLQTLIISPKFTLRYVKSLPCQVHLPSKIWRMPQLRHLVCYNFGELPIKPEERGREGTCALKNLQTLWAVTNLRCSVRILKMIPNVKKLGLFYPDGCKDGDGEGYHFENLVLLQQLEKLKLTNHDRFSYWTMEVVPTLPKTLKKLTLECWRLKWGNMRAVGLLPNLQVLKLKCSSRVGNKWETSEGDFPQLKYLLMEKSPLKYWITENSHFPSLKRLSLRSCWDLIEIPDCIGEIPTLELIEFDHCSKSLVDSA